MNPTDKREQLILAGNEFLDAQYDVHVFEKKHESFLAKLKEGPDKMSTDEQVGIILDPDFAEIVAGALMKAFRERTASEVYFKLREEVEDEDKRNAQFPVNCFQNGHGECYANGFGHIYHVPAGTES